MNLKNQQLVYIPISTGFYIAIKDSTIIPKLIDYGKSAIEPTYMDA